MTLAGSCDVKAKNRGVSIRCSAAQRTHTVGHKILGKFVDLRPSSTISLSTDRLFGENQEKRVVFSSYRPFY